MTLGAYTFQLFRNWKEVIEKWESSTNYHMKRNIKTEISLQNFNFEISTFFRDIADEPPSLKSSLALIITKIWTKRVNDRHATQALVIRFLVKIISFVSSYFCASVSASTELHANMVGTYLPTACVTRTKKVFNYFPKIDA